MRLVLASTSPQRKRLLEQCGLWFDVVSVDVDERRHDAEPPAEYVERLAREKAVAADCADPETVVVGGDTIVVHRGRVLGKPAHPDEARRMLQALRGGPHSVLSGVAVLGGTAGVSVGSDRTLVQFGDLTDAEIDAYVATGEPMERAGAYALQGRAGMFVERIEGDPTSVIGLPLGLVVRHLRRHGVTVLGQTS